MAQAALAEAIEKISIMPPAFRLDEALHLLDDMRSFEQRLHQEEQRVADWRVATDRRLAEFGEIITRNRAGLSDAEVAETVLPVLDRLIELSRDIIAGMQTPFTRDPKVQAIVRGARGNREASLFVNRSVARVDGVRRRFLEGHEHYFYELVALRAHYDPEAKPNTTEIENAADLGAFLDRLTHH